MPAVLGILLLPKAFVLVRSHPRAPGEQRSPDGRRKTEAAVEASIGSLDHKCTLVHLALGGQVCLGYRGGRLPSRESRDVEGVEVPDIRSEHRPPIPFYPSGGLPRYRRKNVF
jgi:hypothetical protein